MTDNFKYLVDRDNLVLAWRVSGQITYEEVIEIVGVIKGEVEKLPKGKVKLLVDNRPMVDSSGKAIIFTIKVNEEWVKLQQWLLGYCSHVAVLCETLMMKSQMNRLAKESGLESVLQAYWYPQPERAVKEAFNFLGITSNPLVK